jgi:3-(methylsulfanyl)propanoyl-CoA dehydrogenase
MDRAHRSQDPEQKASNQARIDLLMPVVKAWCTEVAQEVTTLGIQIHGGMGFIEETGADNIMELPAHVVVQGDVDLAPLPAPL